MQLLTHNSKQDCLNLSVLENLNRKRERQSLRNKRLYYLQSTFRVLRTTAIIAFGVWCYASRYMIREYIIDAFSHLY
jgi:hypothetical protein